MGVQIVVVGMCDDVDQRIAQAENVYGFDHGARPPCRRALLALPRREVKCSCRRDR
jgi:hypothetical protein